MSITPQNQPLIEASNLTVRFPTGRAWPWQQQRYVHAVTGVSLGIAPGETLGIVGESGCGKSTLGRALIRLGPAGEHTAPGSSVILRLNDSDPGYQLVGRSEKDLRPIRRQVQIVFQDPASSLNPRMRIGDIIAEPLRNFGMKREQARVRILELMDLVGLRRDMELRYPHEFSGGQQQRVGIARALALNPRFIVCDEPVSALDVSIQAQVLNLLTELRRELGLTLLFISHDLRVVRHLCDRIAVMYLGRIVELGTADQIVGAPQHPYTRALISAIPGASSGGRTILTGELPSPASPPSGCAFRTRCPMATEACGQQIPSLRTIGGRQVACDQL